jgi:Flp pilus assembly protein TadD
MAKLFLSYSRNDASIARRFTDWLEREDHDVWRDEDDIGGGASFSSEIEKALKDCDAVLVLWSAQSAQSAWVRDEACAGRDAGKLIPFSIDGTEPPLGFRQFQSIDLSNWRGRGPPPAAERIRNAIRRIATVPASISAAGEAPASSRRKEPLRFLPRKSLAGAILVLGGAGIAGALLWQHSPASRGITIAVIASPNSPDRATSADYANVIAADMAAFLPTRFERATVIAPADANDGIPAYRMLISADRRGTGAGASLTLSDADGHTILWSKSWSVPDASSADLPQQVSRSASLAALCLAEARGGSERLDQPALGLYVSGCVGVEDPEWSDAQLVTTFERIVQLAPKFPPAWGSLAVGRAIFAEDQKDRSGRFDDAAVRSARTAVATARKLDPRSGLAYVAEWHLINEDPQQALALLDKAVQVAPGEPLLHARRSDSLASVGRMEDSVAEARRAVELDPLSSFTRSKYILALTYAGDISRAKTDIIDARKKWPNDPNIDWAEFSFQYRYGDPRAAGQLITRALDYSDAELIPYRKLISARLDPSPSKIDDAIASFKAEDARQARGPNRELLALGLFGKTDEAYGLLSDPAWQPKLDPSLLFRPEFAGVRADPRFMGIAARFRLVHYWRRTGNWPDFCSSEQLHYDCKIEAAKLDRP